MVLGEVAVSHERSTPVRDELALFWVVKQGWFWIRSDGARACFTGIVQIRSRKSVCGKGCNKTTPRFPFFGFDLEQLEL